MTDASAPPVRVAMVVAAAASSRRAAAALPAVRSGGRHESRDKSWRSSRGPDESVTNDRQASDRSRGIYEQARPGAWPSHDRQAGNKSRARQRMLYNRRLGIISVCRSAGCSCPGLQAGLEEDSGGLT